MMCYRDYAFKGLPDRRRRLELLDRGTERQRLRQAGKLGSRLKQAEVVSGERGWRRDDLYERRSG